jgi:hypothetical protein
LAAKAESTYDLIIQQAQNSAVIHADETGWLIGGKSAWLWVFTNCELTIYAIRYSRAHGVIEEILGVEFDGVLVSDFFSAYNPIDCDKAKWPICSIPFPRWKKVKRGLAHGLPGRHVKLFEMRSN